MPNILLRAVGALLLLASTSVETSAQVSNLEKVYPTFEVDTLGAIFAEAGLPYQVTLLEGGTPLMIVGVGSNNSIFVAPTRCKVGNSSQCYGLIMLAAGSVQQLPYQTLGENLVIVNFLNQWMDFAKAYMMVDSNVPMVGRHLISDYGVSKGNILTSIQLLVDYTNYFFQALYEARNSSAELPGFSAESLSPELLPELRSMVPAASMAGAPGSIPLDPRLKGFAKGPDAIWAGAPELRSLEEQLGILLSSKDFGEDFSYKIPAERN